MIIFQLLKGSGSLEPAVLVEPTWLLVHLWYILSPEPSPYGRGDVSIVAQPNLA